jgi:hypothetical protein
MRKQHKHDSANATCRDAGHDWMSTAADNFRVCKREQCRASERLVNGQWTSNAKAYRFHDPVITSRRQHNQPRQTMMWNSEQSRRRDDR